MHLSHPTIEVRDGCRRERDRGVPLRPCGLRVGPLRAHCSFGPSPCGLGPPSPIGAAPSGPLTRRRLQKLFRQYVSSLGQLVG